MEDLKKILEKIELSLKAKEKALAEEAYRIETNKINKLMFFDGMDRIYLNFQEEFEKLAPVLESRFTIKCSKWNQYNYSIDAGYKFGTILITPNFVLDTPKKKIWLDGNQVGIDILNIALSVFIHFDEYSEGYKNSGYHLRVIAELNPDLKLDGEDIYCLSMNNSNEHNILHIINISDLKGAAFWNTWRSEINAESLLIKTLNYCYSAEAPNA
jgi:hypothetical protein